MLVVARKLKLSGNRCNPRIKQTRFRVQSMPRGRPSAYKSAFAEQAEKLCRLGATDADLAEFFKVSTQTISAWSNRYPEFLHARKAGKDEAGDRIERSLYHRAVGYTFDSEKVFQFQGKVVRAKTREHIPPDVIACIFWLKNRRPELWRDKHDVEHSGEVGIADRFAAALARLEGQKDGEDEPPSETAH
jgi:hypothetical protein